MQDNGPGMEQEKADTLVTYQAQGYGLKNVNDRIRLLYGEDYAVRIFSRPGEGTKVGDEISQREKKGIADENEKDMDSSPPCGAVYDVRMRRGRGQTYNTGQEVSEETRRAWEKAGNHAYGSYPELVTYTLGQMNGANNSNLPQGNTYEDNAYTRYLRQMLNIQNENVYMESEDRYDEFVNIIVKDRTLPDILVVSDRETLKELVENDLVEDLTDVFEKCTSPRIKAMYESYGSGLLDSGRFDGKTDGGSRDGDRSRSLSSVAQKRLDGPAWT